GRGTVVGRSDCSSVSARSRLFRARPRRDPTAGTSFGSQAATATGRRLGSPAARISRPYENVVRAWWTLNQTALCGIRLRRNARRAGGSYVAERRLRRGSATAARSADGVERKVHFRRSWGDERFASKSRRGASRRGPRAPTDDRQ